MLNLFWHFSGFLDFIDGIPAYAGIKNDKTHFLNVLP